VRFLWDQLSTRLQAMYQESWAQPCSNMNDRREVALIFSTRVARRCAALDALFRLGLYDQAVPLVRAAYEDWLTIGTILVTVEDDSLAARYREDVVKTEAQLLKSFRLLAGDEACETLMAGPPPEVLQLTDLPAAKLRVSGNWRSKAVTLSLAEVHDYIHPYLSEIAHGNARNQVYLFSRDPDDDGIVAPVTMKRDEEVEQPLALWAWWFQLRVLTIAARERGTDFEHHTDELLDQLRQQGKHLTLQTACFRRESTPSGA